MAETRQSQATREETEWPQRRRSCSQTTSGIRWTWRRRRWRASPSSLRSRRRRPRSSCRMWPTAMRCSTPMRGRSRPRRWRECRNARSSPAMASAWTRSISTPPPRPASSSPTTRPIASTRWPSTRWRCCWPRPARSRCTIGWCGPGDGRCLPLQLEMCREAQHEHDVDRPVADGLVGDRHVPGLGVVGWRATHPNGLRRS